MMIRKIERWLLAILMLCNMPPAAAQAANPPRIGLLVYNGTDTFMRTVCTRIQEAAGNQAVIELMDGGNSQIVQNEQAEALLQSGVDALIINPVDRTAAIYLIRAAKAKDVPVVFINREPLYEDLALYNKAYYTGNDPKESGAMSGRLIAQYFRLHQGTAQDPDRNGDGVIQYVMLKGEPGHQDAELRTIYSVKAIREAGFAVENLMEETAMWERAMAQEKMSHIIASYGEDIECVLANNDEMALGAIEALKAAGFFTEDRYLPVVGVDATSHAIEALRDGTLLGTVLNDGEAMGDAAMQLALLLARNKPIDGQSFPYPIDQGVYVWIPSREVTADTLEGR